MPLCLPEDVCVFTVLNKLFVSQTHIVSSALDAEVSLALLSDQVHGSDMLFHLLTVSLLKKVICYRYQRGWVYIPRCTGHHQAHDIPLSPWCDSRALGGVALAMSYGLKVHVSILSACTSASLEPSYVLRAIGTDEDLAHSSIRSVPSANAAPVFVPCLVR